MKTQNIASKLILAALFVIMLSTLASAFTINNTMIESEGLNTNISINETITLDVLDVQDDYIYMENLTQTYAGDTMIADIYITATDSMYYFNASHKDLPYISSSTDLVKVISTGLVSNQSNASLSFYGPCGSVHGKDIVRSITLNNAPIDFVCSNNVITMSNIQLRNGDNTFLLDRYQCLGLSTAEISLYILIFLALAFGIFTALSGPSGLKIGFLVTLIVGMLILIIIVAQTLNSTIC